MKMKKIILFTLVLLIVTLILPSCATILDKRVQKIHITSFPSQAKIQIDGNEVGTTPTVVLLKRSKEHKILIFKEGYQSQELILKKKFNYLTLGNVVNGFVPGMLIDWASGAIYILEPNKILFELEEKK